MRIHIIYIITAMLALTSCDKFLDVKPKGKLIPQTIVEYEFLLDNEDIVKFPFLSNNTASYFSYLTDNLELSENLGKYAYKQNNSPNLSNYYAYTFRKPYANPDLPDYFWDWGIYRSMKYFNNVIDGIHGLGAEGNSPEAHQVLAQAYTARAWVYFHAALIYGPVYNPGATNDFKTIPYLIDSDVSRPIPNLSTQQEVFDNVLLDLHRALPHAPERTSSPSRAGKMATEATLAYYHLFTQQYDSVFYYSNEVWKQAAAAGPEAVIYDFNTLSLSDPANPHTSAISSPDNRIHLPTSREILFFRATEERAGTINNSYPSAEFMDLFDQQNDLRYPYYLLNAPGYKTTVGGVVYDDGDRVQYFRGSPAGIGASTNPKFRMTSGFTYPEVLLMRAEALARLNRLPEAIADLNLLRKFRYLTGTADLAIPATQDQAIQLILEERRRELPIGHFKRFLDLKRYVLDRGKPWSKTTITHRLGEESFEAQVNSDDFIVPKSNVILNLHPEWNVPLEVRPF